MNSGHLHRDERGGGLLEPILTISGTMLFVLMVGVLIMWQVMNGVVHSAADQGSRAGSRIGVDSVAACEMRARQALTNMFPGAGSGADVRCAESGGVVTATIRMVVTGGVPPFRTAELTAGASSRKEVAP